MRSVAAGDTRESLTLLQGGKVEPQFAHLLGEIPLLNQVENPVPREGGLVECFVPTELIDHEEVPVKHEWAEALAVNMRGRADEIGSGTGQKTPIQLGWIHGEDLFKIVDGFHRDAALVINKTPSVFSTVENTTWDRLYDERILTAKDHAHVRFSRVVRWMQEVWQHSGLSDQMQLKQAILLYRYDTSGQRLALEGQQVDAAKEWVARKEAKWDLAAMTIYEYLESAEQVDPALVAAVRVKRSGHKLEAPTQPIIKIFSKDLPGDFVLQNLVWRVARDNNLSGPQVKAVAELVRNKDAAAAQAAIEQHGDIGNIKPSHGETKQRQQRRRSDPRHKGLAVLDGAAEEIERVNARVLASLERGEPVDAKMVANLNATIARAKRLQKSLGTLAANISRLKEQAPRPQEISAKAPPVHTIPTRQQVTRWITGHKATTLENADRRPQARNRSVTLELPSFGKFTDSDWASLEPHVRFALTLDHPKITKLTSHTGLAFFAEVLQRSHIESDGPLPHQAPAVQEHVRTLNTTLALLGKELGRKIIAGKDGRAVITTDGKKYLKEIVTNAQLANDDTGRSQGSAAG